MGYIGSKQKLLGFLKTVIGQTVGDLSDKVFCDMFAGTGVVGRSFKNEVKKLIANDLEYYSYVLLKNYIGNVSEIDVDNLFFELNSLPGKDGLIYKNYCFGGSGSKMYFSDSNGRKLDAIRQRIEELKNGIDDNAYFLLLASLLESADKVANTATVYASHLKQLKKSARKDLILTPANFHWSNNTHDVYCMNANALIHSVEGDVLYLDPPYNHRQYGLYYHLLNAIAKYEINDYQRSNWCSSGKVEFEFEYLIRNARFKYIFLSYNNEGIMPTQIIRAVMEKYGKYDLAETEYQRFKADKTENRNHKADKVVEYLHILEKFT